MRVIIICVIIAVIYCIYDRIQTNKRAAQDNIKQRLEHLEASRENFNKELVAASKRIDELESIAGAGDYAPAGAPLPADTTS